MRRRIDSNGSRTEHAGPGFLQSLVERFMEGVCGQMAASFRETVESARARAVSSLVAAGLLIAGSVFLLTAGLLALRSIPLPAGVSEAIVGIAGLTAAWFLLRRPARTD